MQKNSTYKQIKLIYFVIVITLAIFAAFSFYYILTIGKVSTFETANENNMKSLSIVLALIGIPASYMFHKRKVSRINQSLSIESKLMHYKSAYFIKIATLEGLSLISLLIYLSTGHINQLIIFGLIYLFLLLNYPSQSTIQRELENNDKNDN